MERPFVSSGVLRFALVPRPPSPGAAPIGQVASPGRLEATGCPLRPESENAMEDSGLRWQDAGSFEEGASTQRASGEGRAEPPALEAAPEDVLVISLEQNAR